MAIKAVRIKKRLTNLASNGRVTEVAVADFRSLEEIRVFLFQIAKDLVDYENRVKSLKELFLKLNITNRINKRKETAAGSNFSFDAENVDQQIEKYGDQRIDQRLLKVFDPGIASDDKKIPVKILPHDYQALRKNFMGVEDWYSKLESLSVIQALLHTNFKGAKDVSQLNGMTDAFKKRIEKANAAAYAFLEKHAKKLAPAYYTDIVTEVVDKLEENYLGEYFEDIQVKTYLTADEKEVEVESKSGKTKKITKYDLKFITYVKLVNLQDESGSIADEAYLMYLASVNMDTMKMTMYVTFANRFVSPLKVLYGRSIFHNVDSAWAHTSSILSTQFGLRKITQNPWPQTPKKMGDLVSNTNYGNSVSDVSINDQEELIIQFKPDVNSESKAATVGDKIRQEIQLYLTALVKKRVPTQMRIDTSEGRWEAAISLGGSNLLLRDEKAERLLFDKLRRMGIPLTEKEIRSFIRRRYL